MATTIASLNVLLNANTGKYQKKMTAAQRKATQFQAGIKLATSAMATFGATMAASSVIGSMRAIVDELDRMAKMARRLEITMDALGGFQFAAGIAGVSAEQFGKSIQMMSRRIGEADQGLGEGKRAFESLGLSVTELVNQSPDEAFLTIADAISKVESVSLKAALANQAFGRSGVDLLNLINQGRGGIETLTDEFERLNGSFGDSAERAEAAKDAILRFEVAWGSLTRTLTVDVLPALTKSSNAMSEFISNNREWIMIVVKAFNPAIDLMSSYGSESEMAASGVDKLTAAQEAANAAMATGAANGDKLLERLREEVDLFGTNGFDRELKKLISRGGLSSAQVTEATGLIGLIGALKRESTAIPVAPPDFAVGRQPQTRGLFPNPAVPRAMGGDGAAASQFLATRAVDAGGGNSISSELAGRQATEAERSRIQEKMLEEMQKNTREIVNGFRLLESDVSDDVPFEIGG